MPTLYRILVLLCLIFPLEYYSQEADVIAENNENSSEKTDENAVAVDLPTSEFIFRPKLSLGIGMFTFYGDISTNHKGYHPTVSRLAYDLRLINPLTDYLDMNFYVLFGQVSANERTLNRNLNFNSNITTGGLTLTYNFKNLAKWKSNVHPYISAGIESVEFLSKSDLYDANGNYYYYWSDGRIMNMAEDDPNASSATEIYRDYTYESDLRELNLDGYENYPERSFAFPVEIGANFILSDRVNFRVSTSMHFTQTDLIDNVTSQSVGNRAGTKGNDKFLYTSVSMTYDLSFGKGGKEGNDGYDEWMNLYAQDTSDYDQDGVGDLADLCAKTPLDARPVDEFGCPLDNDVDGVSDNLDDELNTPEGAPVDEHGVALTDEDFELRYRMYKDSIGEFASFDEVTNISESEGGKKFGGNTDGIVMGSKEKYTVIIGSDSTGITANDLHKFLSFKDFKIIDDGENVYYIVGEFDNLNDAVAARNQLNSQGFETSVGKTGTGNNGKTNVKEVPESELPVSGGTANLGQGTIYKIQIGAFSKKLSSKVFGDTKDLTYVKGDDGLWRYYAGAFTDKKKAAEYRIGLVEKGYKGSFIVVFKDGDRLTLEQGGFQVTEGHDDTNVESSTPTTGVVNKDLIKFKVQVGAFQNKIPTDILDLYLSIGNVLPKKDEESGLTKYFIGTHKTYQDAEAAKKQLQEKGLVDAFVVGDFNGKIITAQEALDLLK
ncbi:MAG: SPOR domain-containing protein [Flavobacteriales bacterium]|nr:SPOR domain-containing protein [Flavobacteriales bacterium]MCB9196215.1 SPOR domain-containing protein [Flavobacteriales bacterium]